MGAVISFINQKGGVGKTTMAFNVAFALKKENKKVLVIDFDPQANITQLLQAEANVHIHHLLINSIKELKYLHTPMLLSECIQKKEIDIIPGGQDLSGFELTVAGINSPRQLILKKFIELNSLKNRYDYILIDCPPTLGLLAINAICASDGIIIPFKACDFSAKGLENFYQVLNDVEEMGIVEIPEVILHIPNLVEGRRKQEINDLDKITNIIENKFQAKRLSSVFHNKSPIAKSIAEKKSVFDFHSKDFSELQDNFTNMAKNIIEWNQGTSL